MTSSRTIACWSRWASDLPFGWHLPLNFSRRQRSDSHFWTAPWSWTHGDRPACARSRCSQQTDKQIPLITEPLAISWNVSHTIVVGRSTSGSHCVKHMLQACDKFGVMGWRKYIKIVSPAKRHVQWTALAWKNGFKKMCKFLVSQCQSLIYIYIILV